MRNKKSQIAGGAVRRLKLVHRFIQMRGKSRLCRGGSRSLKNRQRPTPTSTCTSTITVFVDVDVLVLVDVFFESKDTPATRRSPPVCPGGHAPNFQFADFSRLGCGEGAIFSGEAPTLRGRPGRRPADFYGQRRRGRKIGFRSGNPIFRRALPVITCRRQARSIT